MPASEKPMSEYELQVLETGLHATVESQRAAAEIRRLRSTQPDLWSVLAAMGIWADATFPREGVAQKLEHLSEELTELRSDPCDLEEWADCFSLLFDAARKHKLSPEQITLSIRDKFEKNKLRKWDDGGQNGVYHHVKETPAQPDCLCRHATKDWDGVTHDKRCPLSPDYPYKEQPSQPKVDEQAVERARAWLRDGEVATTLDEMMWHGPYDLHDVAELLAAFSASENAKLREILQAAMQQECIDVPAPSDRPQWFRDAEGLNLQ